MVLGVVAASLIACVKDIQLKTVEPQIAIPLAYGRIDVTDLLARQDTSDLIQADGSGLMALIYDANVFRMKGADLIKIPNSQSEVTINSPITRSAPQFPEGSSAGFNGSSQQSFSLGNVELRKLVGKGGLLNLTVFSTFANDVAITLEIPNATKNGDTLSVDLNIESTDNSSKFKQKTVSLEGYEFLFSANNGMDFNYTATINSRGNAVEATDELRISFAFNNVRFSRLELNSANETFDLPPAEIDLKLFRNSAAFADVIDFEFFDPEVELTFINGFVLGSEIIFDSLLAIGTNDGSRDEIFINGGTDSFVIRNPNQIGDTAQTVIKINKNNSNIGEQLTPDKQIVKYDFTFNTLSSVSPAVITDNAELAVDGFIKLPLRGFAEGWTIANTLSLDGSIIEESVVSGEILLNLKNQFPFEADLQLYTVSNGNITDSLILGDPTILAAGDINQQTGKADVRESIRSIKVGSDQMNNLRKADSIRMEATIRTSDAENNTQVAIFKEYFMEVSIGLAASISVNN